MLEIPRSLKTIPVFLVFSNQSVDDLYKIGLQGNKMVIS